MCRGSLAEENNTMSLLRPPSGVQYDGLKVVLLREPENEPSVLVERT